ncbi:hypothetical protein [Haliea sp.]|uniref:hypothetical protein n=1 Tax=Haliea sp. TaxID=1932666 RepID=UPI002579A9DF|nr:hypothetical protein [Haliea sp.]
MATLFETCSVIMYAGAFRGDNTKEGTSFSLKPTSGIGDFTYTGSTGISGSTRINSALNFQEFTTNSTPKIDYSYSSSGFAFITGSTIAQDTFTSSISTGRSVGSLILEGETNNNFITPITFTATKVNTVTSSLDKFPTEGNYDYNVIIAQENSESGAHFIDFEYNYTLDSVKLARLSFCVSGGAPFNSLGQGKDRLMNFAGNQNAILNPRTGDTSNFIINPGGFTDSLTNSKSSSIFVRSSVGDTEITDIGDGWLRCSSLITISQSGATDKLRVRFVENLGVTGSTTNGSNNVSGSGSTNFTDNNPANFTSSIPTFAFANFQLETIDGPITGSLTGSVGTVSDFRNNLAFVPATSFIPISGASITKPSESLELPLTSSTISELLTEKNQGTIITRLAWTPVSGSDEASSNQFALLNTGSGAIVDSDLLRMDGRGIFYRNEAGTLVSLTSESSQVPYLTQSGSLFSNNYHNYAFTFSGSTLSCSIDSGSILSSSTNMWEGSATEQLEYIGGIMNISPNTQVRVQYIMVSPHKFSADDLKNATNTTLV